MPNQDIISLHCVHMGTPSDIRWQIMRVVDRSVLLGEPCWMFFGKLGWVLILRKEEVKKRRKLELVNVCKLMQMKLMTYSAIESNCDFLIRTRKSTTIFGWNVLLLLSEIKMAFANIDFCVPMDWLLSCIVGPVLWKKGCYVSVQFAQFYTRPISRWHVLRLGFS